MIKTLWIILSCSMLYQMSAQKPMETTNRFMVEGLVKKLVVNLDSFKK